MALSSLACCLTLLACHLHLPWAIWGLVPCFVGHLMDRRCAHQQHFPPLCVQRNQYMTPSGTTRTSQWPLHTCWKLWQHITSARCDTTRMAVVLLQPTCLLLVTFLQHSHLLLNASSNARCCYATGCTRCCACTGCCACIEIETVLYCCHTTVCCWQAPS